MAEELTLRAQEIEETAAELFARHGYSGVSVRDICTKIGVNCSTISYYFGGKAGLYRTILRNQFKAYENALDQLEASCTSQEVELAELCQRVAEVHASCPHFSAITVREGCNPSPEFIEAFREHEARYHGGHLSNLVKHGQQKGVFNRSLNPIYLSRLVSLLINSQIIAKSYTEILHPEFEFKESDFFETVKTVLFQGLITPKAERTTADEDADSKTI